MTGLIPVVKLRHVKSTIIGEHHLVADQLKPQGIYTSMIGTTKTGCGCGYAKFEREGLSVDRVLLYRIKRGNSYL